MSLEIETSSENYGKRIDTLAIKRELQELVPDEEYWTVFRLFLNGHCERAKFDRCMNKYLVTNEQRHKHNQFVKAILHNAHYAASYPPNYVPHPPKAKQKEDDQLKYRCILPKSQKLKTYLAADLHALPSVSELEKRLEIKAHELGFIISKDAVEILHEELNNFILHLLAKSLETVGKSQLTKRTVKITTENVKAAINTNDDLVSIISADLLSKFADF